MLKARIVRPRELAFCARRSRFAPACGCVLPRCRACRPRQGAAAAGTLPPSAACCLGDDVVRFLLSHVGRGQGELLGHAASPGSFVAGVATAHYDPVRQGSAVSLRRVLATGGGTAAAMCMPAVPVLQALSAEGCEIALRRRQERPGTAHSSPTCRCANHGVSTGKLRRYVSLENLVDCFRNPRPASCRLGGCYGACVRKWCSPRADSRPFQAVVGAWLNRIPGGGARRLGESPRQAVHLFDVRGPLRLLPTSSGTSA